MKLKYDVVAVRYLAYTLVDFQCNLIHNFLVALRTTAIWDANQSFALVWPRHATNARTSCTHRRVSGASWAQSPPPQPLFLILILILLLLSTGKQSHDVALVAD